MKLHHLAAVAVFAFGGSLSAQAADAPIRIVAAENFYGDAATAIGGDHVAVESIIVSPGTDPHDFEPAPSVARGVADAAVVIMNGADYDPWMERLLESSEARQAHRDRRRRTDRQEGRRQSAPLVRPEDDAGARRGADPALVDDRSGRRGRTMRPGSKPSWRRSRRSTDKIAEHQGALRRRAGHRDRAGLRLHGGGARPRHAQRATSSSRS